jgi:hypothetical protein
MTKALHIGFTGSREGMSDRQYEILLEWLRHYKRTDGEVVLHHGDCIGADAQAHQAALLCDVRVVIHPCTLTSQRAFCKGYSHAYEPLPPLERNSRIVQAADIVIATPKESTEQLRSGTWATIRRARKAHKPVEIISPVPMGAIQR